MFPLNLRADGHTSTWSARARMLLAFGYGVALHSDPFLSLVSLAALVWKDKKYQKPQKKEKTKKEEKITTTTKKQIKHGEFEVHLCKSIQELKRGCGRPRSVSIVNSRPASPHCFCLCFSLDSYFSVQPIVGHQSFFVGAPNPAAWGGAGTLRVLGDSASNLGIPLATAPRFGQRNLLMLSGATLAALLRSGRTIL